MSHAHKVGFSDDLDGEIRRVQAERRLASYNDTVRYLVVLGLAAEWDKANRSFGSSNPYLSPYSALLET